MKWKQINRGKLTSRDGKAGSLQKLKGEENPDWAVAGAQSSGMSKETRGGEMIIGWPSSFLKVV